MSLVLVADDEPAVLEVLSEVVLDLGHEVVRAYDGREALQLARTHRPQLVITDHMMPRLSGADLCRQLRREEALKHVPVILLSAALTEGIPEAQAFLPKPFELSEFEALVRRTLLEAPAPAGERPAEGAQAGHDALVSHVANGLRSPLSSARGHLERLREALQSGGPTDPTSLQALEGELDSMDRLVQGLVDAAQLADGRLLLQRARTDLAALLQRAVADWKDRQPDFTFHLALPDGRVEASCDAARLRQVVDALLDNAVRHAGAPRRVEVALSASPAHATLTVTDFGRGLPAAELGTLLERIPGPTLLASGRGLGLFIARELTRLHGGALSVRSAEGQGASFSLLLPRES